MNKRQRAILARLEASVTEYRNTIDNGPEAPRRDVPGLAIRARPSADAAAELLIYGRIGGGGFFSEGISAADVAGQLREAGAGPLNVRINSGGGDVFEGVAIHSLLARHNGTVTVYVDGLAASAASFIMLAGDRIVSARNAFVMIHDAMTMTYGNGNTHRASGDLLDKVSENIADMYAERAGEDVDHWRNLMTVNGEDGTWYTGQEALESGLIDELTEVKDDAEEAEAVARMLSGWSGVLGAKALAFLAEHPEPAEEDDDPEPEPEDTPEQDETTNDRGLAFAMLAANLK